MTIKRLLSFECPDCGAVSYHPTDIIEGYCELCGSTSRPICAAARVAELPLLKLVQRWRIEAAAHQAAGDEIAEREDWRSQEEEMTLNYEASRVYRKCAEELLKERAKE
jgi:hypothetical protein